MSDKLISDIMHKGVIACSPDTPMTEVVRIVSDTEVHAIIVMDGNNHPLGIVSHTDIIRLFGKDLTTYTAKDVMSHNVFDIAANEPAQKAAETLLKHGVHRLLVVEVENTERHPVGIISTTDLVKEMRGSRWVWYMG